MEAPSPSRDEWQRLYKAAIAFKHEAPWEWMHEDDVFGVRNPETGQIGCGSVMGGAGEYLALAIYLGGEGLAGFWQMHSEDPHADAYHLLEIPQLQASFESRGELHAKDRHVIKDLGHKFRGRQAWPQFRSYVPGCAPWFLNPEEARFLTVSLEQAVIVVQRVRDDPDLLEPSDQQGDAYLVRVLREKGWTDEWLVPEPAEAPVMPRPNQKRLARLRKDLPLSGSVLEADLFVMPQYVKDKEDPRPYLVYNLLTVDAESGFILGTEVLLAKPDYGTMWAGAQASLLQLMERQDSIPQLVAVRDKRLAQIIGPIADILGFETVVSGRLPALDQARASFERWIR